MERWVIEKLYADGDAKVRIIKQLTGESFETFKTQIEVKAAANLAEGESLRENQAFVVDQAALDRIQNVSREGIEKIELDREMQKLPDEAMHRLNRILRYCRGAHDIKEALESKAFEDLMHDFPIFEEYRKITISELAEELKLPRKTYTDVVDRIASDLQQMDINSRLQLHQHLKHAFEHPFVRHLVTAFPSIEMLEKLILDEIIPNPTKKKEDPAALTASAVKATAPAPSASSAAPTDEAKCGDCDCDQPSSCEKKEEKKEATPKKRKVKQGKFEMEVDLAELDQEKEVTLDDLTFLDE